MMEIKGIDVSRWQGDIDWEKAYSGGVRFAMIKAAQGRRPDPRFLSNLTGAGRAGVFAGAYVYSLAKTPKEAEAEADAVTELIGERELRYPVAIDVEDAHFEKLAKAERGSIVSAFCERIGGRGHIPMIYSNHDWFTRMLPRSVTESYYVWLAWWRSEKPSPGYDLAVWQSGTGSVPGIEGEVDLDVSFVDFAALTKPPAPFRLETPRLRGEEYLAMQNALNAAGYRDDSGSPLAEDGVWGERSRQAFCRLTELNR